MIERIETNQRMSKIVKHNGVVYLSGLVGDANKDIKGQTSDCLEQVESYLTQAGSSIDKILRAEIWIADMQDFAAMNEVWDAWVPEGHAPTRACGESKLARKELLVEIIITAAYDTDYNY